MVDQINTFYQWLEYCGIVVNRSGLAKDENNIRIYAKSLSKIDIRLAKENYVQLVYLLNKYPKIKEFIKNDKLIFKAEKLPVTYFGETKAYLSRDKNAISLNISTFEDYDRHIELIRDYVALKTYMPASAEKLSVYTLNHEFGHLIQNYLFSLYDKVHQKEYEKIRNSWHDGMSEEETRSWQKKIKSYSRNIAININCDIIKIVQELDEPIGDSYQSEYSYHAIEFFAECFANLESGAVNSYGKAVEIFMQRSDENVAS